MKKNYLFLYVLIFIHILSSAQSKLVGSALITDSQKNQLQARRTASSGKWVVDTNDANGFTYGTWNLHNTRATAFFNDVDNNGGDSQRWSSFDITDRNTEPKPLANGIGDHIHSAAIIAHMENDVVKALKVFNELVIISNNADFNASTFPINTSDGNPRFIAAAKMAKYVESYGEIQPLIASNATYLANYANVELMFKRWADWSFGVSNLKGIQGWGSNWRSGTYNVQSASVNRIAYDDALGNSGSSFGAQQYTHYLADGTGVNSINFKQAWTGNNRSLDIAYLAYVYGVYFDDQDYKDFGFDFYKAWMEICVFPDGTLAEWYRSYESLPHQGFTYNTITLNAVTRMAHTWAVGVTNGLPNMTDAGKFYDYQTRANVGAETHTTNYIGDNTAGIKDLKMILKNYSRYHRTPANGGHNPQRRAVTGDIYDRTEKRFPFIGIVPNTWYQDSELEAFGNYDLASGYPQTVPFNAGNWIRWDFSSWGALALGTGGYADLNNIFNLPTSPTCTDGIQNGNETDIDCGGPDCSPCNNYNICNEQNPNMSIQPVKIEVSDFQTGHGPCNMMDNNFDPISRWSADGDGQWAQFDLGTSREFDQIEIAFYLGDVRKSYFDIEVSNDAVNWAPVISNQQSSGTSLALEDFNFPIQSTRYVRYLGHGNSQTNSFWNSLVEVKINKTAINVISIGLTPENIFLNIEDTQSLTLEILPVDATNQNVTWTSSNTAIAAVDTNGLVTAIASGTAVITATTNDGGFTDTTSVVVEETSGTDEIVSVDTPTSIAQGSVTNVSVTYSASSARDISVLFKSSSSPYTTYQSTLVSVDASSGTVEIPIAVPSDVPVANYSYRYQILLLPTGQQGWNNRLDAAYVSNVSVTDNAPPTGTDEIVSVDTPTSIARGSTTDVSVTYSASTARDISVLFRSSSSPYTLYQSAVVSVGAGSGIAQIPIAIPSNVPVANYSYRYQILLLPTGQQGWNNRLDAAYVSSISVTNNQSTAFKASLDFQSVVKYDDSETLSVYPNPTINIAIVNIPLEENYSSFSLYSVNGTMVKSGKIDNNQRELPISFSEMDKGMYFLRLSNTKGEEAFKKIIKE